MSTSNTFTQAPKAPGPFRLPDIPEKHPDDMTSFKHLAENSNVGRLKSWLGHPETTIVSGERYVCAAPGGAMRYPDLLVALEADPELYEANNGYVVSLQGRAPDLALEIASRHTWRVDVAVKPEFYAGLGVAEYWRFDETGEFHGTRLAGDRLVEGAYELIVIEELPGDELRGFSETLGLYFCWREGRLDWYDPQAGDYIPSLESERQRADAEREARLLEREARLLEREAAEERIRELEARLRAAGAEE